MFERPVGIRPAGDDFQSRAPARRARRRSRPTFAEELHARLISPASGAPVSLNLVLMSALSRIPHQRNAALETHRFRHQREHFDVVDDLRAGVACKRPRRTASAGREDDLAILGDDASRSPSPSKARPDSARPFRATPGQINEVFRLGGSGWWLGKLPVDLAEQFDASQPMARKIQARCRPGDAVAAVHDDFHRPGNDRIADPTRGGWSRCTSVWRTTAGPSLRRRR